MEKEVVARYSRLVEALGCAHPEDLIDASRLSEAVTDPKSANADQSWFVIWDKPLYAHTKVKIADAHRERLSAEMLDAWRYIGEPGSSVHITKTGPGSRASSFVVVGHTAVQSKVAAHRLFAIQGAARALRKRTAKSATPLADLASTSFEMSVRMLRSEFGPFWGNITVQHLMTDLGMACKPDIHLTRTVRHLGLSVRDGLPSLAESIRINAFVKELVASKDGYLTPSGLRYADKVLMCCSQRGLINRSVQ